MSKFYFTYGSEGHPFYGGWSIIEADDIQLAVAIFKGLHPNPENNLLMCCDVYSEERFKETGMDITGNFGNWCHEHFRLEQIHDVDK